MIGVINSGYIGNSKLFALQLPFKLHPNRSWEELRGKDGVLFDSCAASVKYVGLVESTDDDARMTLNVAIALNRSSSDL
jgi:hypothetical protein